MDVSGVLDRAQNHECALRVAAATVALPLASGGGDAPSPDAKKIASLVAGRADKHYCRTACRSKAYRRWWRWVSPGHSQIGLTLGTRSQGVPELAEETGVSPRQLYRDIATLRAGGALIDGEAGLGYTLAEDPASATSPMAGFGYSGSAAHTN